MLARAADNLFWLARYIERAEYVARIIQVTQRLATLPSASGDDRAEWESALLSAGAEDDFRRARAHSQPTAENVVDFLIYDLENPSSVVNCVENGRFNARAVRTALTAETWDTINSGWLEFQRLKAVGKRGVIDWSALGPLLDHTMKLALDVDGSCYRTMLRNDAYWFARLGLFIERADNTARILDVKYNILLPDTEIVGGSLDYFQWTAILREVSALTAYNWVYRDTVKPWFVADLLIKRPEMPRSLISCYENIVRFLDAIARTYGRQGASQRLARGTLNRLENTPIEVVFASGLHEFITQFLADNDQMGAEIATQYLAN